MSDRYGPFGVVTFGGWPMSPVVARDRVLPSTRVLSLAIIPFLLVAFILLYFWPSADDTARLFAWRIVPGFTSMVLGSVYLGGAYFFLRVVRATAWDTVGAGFVPVGLFAALMGVATIIHWDKFIHANVAFWLWATLYFTTPFLVFAVWLLNRRERPTTFPDDAVRARPVPTSTAPSWWCRPPELSPPT